MDTTGANVNNGSSKMVGNAYQTRWVASSTLTGIYAGLPLAKADWCLAFSDNAKLIFDASPPIGQAAMTNYKLYGVLATTVPTGSPPSVSAVGTQLLSQSTLPITYTPPDTGLRYYQLVATDGTNTYTYHVIPAALESRRDASCSPATRFSAIRGRPTTSCWAWAWKHAARDLTWQSRRWPLTEQARRIFSRVPDPRVIMPNPSISGTVTQLDYLCSRAAAEKAATGANVDWVLLQLAGNTPTTSTANYSTIAGAVLGGNGITNNYTAAVKTSACAGPFQLNGHPINTDFQIVTNNSNLQAASNGTTINSWPGRAERHGRRGPALQRRPSHADPGGDGGRGADAGDFGLHWGYSAVAIAGSGIVKERQQNSASYPLPFLLVLSSDNNTGAAGLLPTGAFSGGGGTGAAGYFHHERRGGHQCVCVDERRERIYRHANAHDHFAHARQRLGSDDRHDHGNLQRRHECGN